MDLCISNLQHLGTKKPLGLQGKGPDCCEEKIESVVEKNVDEVRDPRWHVMGLCVSTSRKTSRWTSNHKRRVRSLVLIERVNQKHKEQQARFRQSRQILKSQSCNRLNVYLGQESIHPYKKMARA